MPKGNTKGGKKHKRGKKDAFENRKLILKDSKEDQEGKIKQLTDIAVLSQGMLKGEELSKFIERSIDLV